MEKKGRALATQNDLHDTKAKNRRTPHCKKEERAEVQERRHDL